MKRLHGLSMIVLLCALLGGCAQKNDSHQWRLIHNNDGTDLLSNLWFGLRPLTLEDLNACVDMICETPITTYMICTGSDFTYYDSKYGRVLGDDCGGALDCGADTAAYTGIHRYYLNHNRLKEQGTDLIRATLERAKSHGKEAFITYRMNDLHFNDTTRKYPIYGSQFWSEHPEYWLRDGDQGYMAEGALNFAHSEVRQHKLDMIFEQIDKYDMIDGFEMDFMRFSVYFYQDSGRYYLDEMTEMVEAVREKIDEVSAARGKKILLAARVPITIEACLDKGLDVRTWLQKGLLDFISIGIHWTGDPAMPVAKFRADLGGDLNIPFYASIDDGGFRPREFYSHGMLRGAVSHNLAQGADGIYMFNYFLGEWNRGGGVLDLEEGGQVCRMRTPDLVYDFADRALLETRNKSYSLSDGRPQYLVMPVSDLPLEVSAASASVANIYVGDSLAAKPQEAILFFRSTVDQPFSVEVNGTALSELRPDYVQLYDRARGLAEGEAEYACIIPAEALNHGYNAVSFTSSSSSCTITRVEIALKYGPVDQNGYF